MNNEMNVHESNVSRLAYQLWENAGCPSGRDLEFWLDAEKSLRNQAKPVIAAVAAPAAATKAAKTTRPGAKRSWPKPYPALPKF